MFYFQVLTFEDLQKSWCLLKAVKIADTHQLDFNVLVHLFPFAVSMFLEDSIVGLQVWQILHQSLVNKISELFTTALQQASLRDGPVCYAAVKVPEEQ